MSKNLKLKGAITECDLSYQDLADDLNISKQTIYNAVKGENVSMDLAKKMCQKLNKSLDELFGNEKED